MLLIGDMGRLADAVARKLKGRSKKTTRGEKRKLETKGKSPLPEHVSDPERDHDVAILELEAVVAEPAAPKKFRAHKKKMPRKRRVLSSKIQFPKQKIPPWPHLMTSGKVYWSNPPLRRRGRK